MLSIRLLGPLEVERDGELLLVPGSKTRILLTRLALEVGSVVSSERLIDALWGADPPGKAANALQAKVSELRRVLGSSLIVTRAPGYVLAVDPDVVDAHRAAALVGEARRLATDHPELASERYASALALWRGREIANLVDPQSGFPIASPLDELRLAAFEERCHLEVAAGRGRPLVGELTTLLAEHPLRETLAELLMRVFAASGRQADALATYRDLRARLVDQLGLEPSPDLRALEARVLAQDAAIVGTDFTTRDVVGASAIVTLAKVRENPPPTVRVPRPLSSFVDRPNELANVVGLLGRRRLVTITGPGGSGKTRLAIEAVQQLAAPPDGTWFVALETVSSVEQVHDALLAVLGGIGATPMEAVHDRLRTTNLLLVLDNCEHLGDALSGVVRRLLEEADGLRVLATSQRAIGVAGEALLPLGPLPRALAAALFVDRARDLVPELRLEERVDVRTTIDEICAQIGDLPLAIELAAGRCDVLSLDEIAGHLRSGFHVLRSTGGGHAGRHQTLDATISWSYNLLFPDAQLMLQALAVFVGGAPIDGLGSVAVALGLPTEEILDLLSHLVARSVVTVERQPHGSRYHLLESIRHFAQAQTIDDGRLEAIVAAHASWVTHLAEAAIAGMHTDAQIAHLDNVRRERFNIDTGLAWLMVNAPARALAVASGLYYAWMILGDGPAGASRIEQALVAAVATSSAEQQGLAGAYVAQLLARSGSIDRALETSAAALDAVAGCSETAQTEVRSIRGKVLVHAGRYDEGRALEFEARYRFEALGNAWGASMARLTVAWADALSGDLDGARDETIAALTNPGSASDAWIAHAGHRLLGVLDTQDGRYDEALAHYAVALDTARAMGSTADECQMLARIATAHSLKGDHPEALATLNAALAMSRLAGDLATERAVRAARDQIARLPG